MVGIDAVLLLSFGGPEAPDEVRPFLERVTLGRGVPPERLAEVAAQYEAFGGVSPINEQNRRLRSELEKALRGNDDRAGLPVFWANRNWPPLLADTLREMRSAGVRSAAVIVTSGYSSYSGCRQYRENLYDAVAEVESDGRGRAPSLHKIRRWFDHPVFIEVMAEHVVESVRSLGALPEPPRLIFTTHSIPISQAEASGPPGVTEKYLYLAEHEFVAGAVAQAASEVLQQSLGWDLVFQSRSGRPSVAWLEPDVGAHLELLAGSGEVSTVVLVPIGFISDHLEVLWDLDIKAMARARELGLSCVRAATVGTDPRFVAALVGMVRERIVGAPPQDRPALSPWGPAPDLCVAGCCRGPGVERPALCGVDSPAIAVAGNA